MIICLPIFSHPRQSTHYNLPSAFPLVIYKKIMALVNIALMVTKIHPCILFHKEGYGENIKTSPWWADLSAYNVSKQLIWYNQFNNLWLADAMWRQIRPTLAPVISCCLTTPSYYLNQWWHISSVRSCGIYPMVISVRISKISTFARGRKLQLLSLFPGVHE